MKLPAKRLSSKALLEFEKLFQQNVLYYGSTAGPTVLHFINTFDRAWLHVLYYAAV